MTDRTPSAAPADEYRGCSTCKHKRLAASREPCLSCATGDGYGWEPATLAATPAPAPAAPASLASDLIEAVLQQCGGYLSGPGFEAAQMARALKAALASPVAAPVVPNLRPVISWLQNGCDPMAAAEELQRYQDRLDAAPQAPIALLWQCRRALALASAICDAVPSRDPGHLGRLVNVQPDGTHGYREIQEAEEALRMWLTTPTAAPQAPAQCPECIEQARLLGMSAEREAALQAQVEQLTRAGGNAPGMADVPRRREEPDVEALAHRIAWRYKKSSDPHHSDTYTFNRATLLQFAEALRSPGMAQPNQGGQDGPL